MLTRQIENAQKSLEGRNYSIRKQVLEYDNVMNTQRGIIYEERGKVLRGESVHEQIEQMMADAVENIIKTYTNPKVDWTEWDYVDMNKEVERKLLPEEPEFFTEERLNTYSIDELEEQLGDAVKKYYAEKVRNAAELGVDMEEVERVVLLKIVDSKWMDHIDTMDVLRREIGLKAYGQQDPVVAYKREGFEMFDNMIINIHEETVGLLMHLNVERAPVKRESVNGGEMIASSGGGKPVKAQPKTATNKEVGRNDPCPCGSGKKYKNCCWEKDHKNN